jgi:hypothetical protein
MYASSYGIIPTELIEEEELKVKASVLIRERKINDRVLGFQDYLETRGVSPNKFSTRVKANIVLCTGLLFVDPEFQKI